MGRYDFMLDRISPKFKNSKNFKGIIENRINHANDLAEYTKSMLETYNLDAADTRGLDNIGDLLGITRPLIPEQRKQSEIIYGEYDNRDTLYDKSLYSSIDQLQFLIQPATNTEYRSILKAVAFINGVDCTISSIIKFVILVCDNNDFFVNNLAGSFTIEVYFLLGKLQKYILLNYMPAPLTIRFAGIREKGIL